MDNPTDLYLDLLKRSLTNTIFDTEPDIDEDDFRFVNQHIEHYVKSDAVSMITLVRFDNIKTCIETILRDRVPGDLIEAGVWRGGASIFMRAVLKAHGVTDRLVWAADSFEGLPEPDPDLFPLEAKAHSGPVIQRGYQNFAASLQEVKRNFAAYELLDDQVKFLKGWFKDTLPTAPIGALSLIRLDGDFYESTRDGLNFLYDRLSIGGYVIIDDYGEDSWTYCRKAVDEFRSERNIESPLVTVDSMCSYWQRTDSSGT
ncbi:MAG TPA: TylF/MycF/NovP-related O-methyltransferase [Terracidiphilus sp.]